MPRASRRLGEVELGVLSAAMERHIAGLAPSSASELRFAIRLICHDARRSDWSPESLVVAFKTAVHSVPALQRLPRGPKRDEFITRLVTLCINEFYGSPELAGREGVESPVASADWTEETERTHRAT